MHFLHKHWSFIQGIRYVINLRKDQFTARPKSNRQLELAYLDQSFIKQSKGSERLVGNVIVIIIAFEPVVFN